LRGAYIELRLAKRQPFRFAKTVLPSLALRCQRMPANSFMNARVAEQCSNPKRGILAFPAPMATRLFNPTIKQSVIDRAYEDDPAVAASEWGGQFRNDLESYVNPEIVDACTARGVYRLDFVKGVPYIAHADPSGGSQDSFTMAIGHVKGDIGILDVLLEKRTSVCIRYRRCGVGILCGAERVRPL
jgi:hypothetical protein